MERGTHLSRHLDRLQRHQQFTPARVGFVLNVSRVADAHRHQDHEREQERDGSPPLRAGGDQRPQRHSSPDEDGGNGEDDDDDEGEDGNDWLAVVRPGQSADNAAGPAAITIPSSMGSHRASPIAS